MSDEDGKAVGSAAGAEEPRTDADGTDTDAGSDPGHDSEPDSDSEDGGPPIEEIAAKLEEGGPEAVAEEFATLREELAAVEADRDDFESRLKRKQAEFQNYKKRQEKRREQERARATEALVEELLEVRDNLKRALEQDESADIREGVEATFRQLDDVLDSEGVEPVEPDPGTPTDPTRHEVLLRVESDRPEGTVADVHRPGYEMAGKVLRPAQVTVSEGPSDDDTDDASKDGASEDDESDDGTAEDDEAGDADADGGESEE